jgi:hypothetical protein
MTDTTTPDYPRGLTFEKVWAALMENREQQKITERMFQETDRKMQKTDRQITRLEKQMGGLHNSFGELAEHLVAPGIAKRFNELGFHFDSIAPGGLRILDETGKTKTEVDLLLENGENIIAVEVKSRVNEKDIEHHIRRLGILKDHLQKLQRKPKKIWGAIAGAVYGTAEKKATLAAGLYVLEQSGDTMKMELSNDFVPREW